MKSLIISAFAFVTFSSIAQIQTPALSPKSELKQVVGLTTIEIDYSRPSKRGRTIFGDVVPFGEIWRTGANENSKIKIDNPLIFGKDTLAGGEYSIFALPAENYWEVYFYTTTDNWGTPDDWQKELIALTTKATVSKSEAITETFTIDINSISTTGAQLVFMWDNMVVILPFETTTNDLVDASIAKAMAGPSSRDYYKSADYYYNEKKEMKQALEWINLAIEKDGTNPFWMLYKKALIQAELKDYKGAIATAENAVKGAKAAGNDSYVTRGENSIKEWSSKK